MSHKGDSRITETEAIRLAKQVMVECEYVGVPTAIYASSGLSRGRGHNAWIVMFKLPGEAVFPGEILVEVYDPSGDVVELDAF